MLIARSLDMKIIFTTFILVSSLLLATVLAAQPHQFTFNTVPLFPENVRGFITGMAQDADGYMWFTGVNLYRYDGYHVTTYKNDPLDSTTISPSRLESIYIDHNGIIWIGTFGSGLDRFDPSTGVFRHFFNVAGDSLSLSNNIVTSIAEDNNGVLWVGTHGGLNRMDGSKGNFSHYKHRADDSSSLSNDQVRVVYKDKKGAIWVGCGSPFGNETPQGEGGLNRLDTNTGTFTRFLHSDNNPHTLSDNKVRAICEDSHGNFWIGTAGDGLQVMDRQTGIVTRFPYDPKHPEKLSAPPKKGEFHHVTFIHEDVAGGIWIGSFPSGLTYYNPTSKEVIRYEASQTEPDMLKENSLWFAFNSRDGVLWLSTQFFVYRVDPLRKHIKHVDLYSRVHAFLEDDSTALWLGTDKGLLYATTTDTISFVHHENQVNSLSNDTVLTLYKDSRNRLWVGTANGLNLFHQDTKSFTRYMHMPDDNRSITQGNVLSILEDKSGVFWVGTDGALHIMNQQTGQFTYFRHNANDSNSLSNNTVKSILQDRSGNLWVGVWSRGGLNLVHTETGRFTRYMEGSNVVNMYEDRQGVLWVATEFGLYRRNSNQTNFERFTDAGSELSTANIVGILEDSLQNLWLGSIAGIYKLNKLRNNATIYGKKYGVAANGLSDMVAYQKHDGEMLFGDGSGYYGFFAGSFRRNASAPQINISDFKIADLPVKPGSGSPLAQQIEHTNEITLTYKQNVFSFEFAGIHYSSPEDNQHLFKLDGYEKHWRKAGSEKAAYYFNVPPGKYVFRVKASSDDGIWAEKSINIIVQPPWWRTWWAYLLYAVILISANLCRSQVSKTKSNSRRARAVA